MWSLPEDKRGNSERPPNSIVYAKYVVQSNIKQPNPTTWSMGCSWLIASNIFGRVTLWLPNLFMSVPQVLDHTNLAHSSHRPPAKYLFNMQRSIDFKNTSPTTNNTSRWPHRIQNAWKWPQSRRVRHYPFWHSAGKSFDTQSQTEKSWKIYVFALWVWAWIGIEEQLWTGHFL